MLPGAVLVAAGSWGAWFGSAPNFRVITDSSRHELRVEYRIPALEGEHAEHEHGGGHGGHAGGKPSPQPQAGAPAANPKEATGQLPARGAPAGSGKAH